MRNIVVFLVALASGCSLARDESIGEARAAQLVSPDLVIADVYGGGGGGGAAFTHDFVVLFNRGTTSASVSGLRLTYGSDTGNFATTGASMLDLADDDIPPGGSYLIRLASGGASGATLPAYDATGMINMSASAGKIALTTATGGLGSCGSTSKPCDPAKWIDLVGWGSSATAFEGSHGGNTVAGTGLTRKLNGCTDTGDNGADLTVGVPATPRSSSTTATPCDPPDLAGVDMASEDLSSTDTATTDAATASNVLLNEVKWNPSGADNGQEFIELIGGGTIAQHVYVLSVDGDGAAAGRINYSRHLGGASFGANGLILIKAQGAAIAGVAAATTVLTEAVFNGSPLQNGTESILLVQASGALTITPGTTMLSSLPAYTILDSIGVRESIAASGHGSAVFAPCPAGSASAVDGASRLVGDARAGTLAAWVGGQGVGDATDQGLIDVTACSGGPPSWAMSPGRPNNDPLSSAPDLAPPPDLALVPDMAQPADAATPKDFAGADLNGTITVDAATEEDASISGPADLAKGPNVRDQGGCSIAPAATGSWSAMLLLLGCTLALRRRRAARPGARRQPQT